MPNFNKSKGFQLRSGNKANAPFKMMGATPAKGIFDNFQPSNVISDLGDKKTKTMVKAERLKGPSEKTKNQMELDKAVIASKAKQVGKKDSTDANATKENKPKEKTKSAAELAAEKAAKKEKRAQAFRDAGEIISNIGDPNTSMVSVMQGQADRRTAKADKATARKDKDIQNKKDIANTKRTNQVIAEHTANLNKDSNKLPADNPTSSVTTSKDLANKNG